MTFGREGRVLAADIGVGRGCLLNSKQVQLRKGVGLAPIKRTRESQRAPRAERPSQRPLP